MGLKGVRDDIDNDVFVFTWTKDMSDGMYLTENGSLLLVCRGTCVWCNSKGRVYGPSAGGGGFLVRPAPVGTRFIVEQVEDD